MGRLVKVLPLYLIHGKSRLARLCMRVILVMASAEVVKVYRR